MDFINSTKSNRLRIIETDKDVIHIYELLSIHLNEPIDVLKSKYDINYHWVRRRIEIKGSMKDIYILFQCLYRWALSFESITSTYLRIDINEFLNKIL